MLLRDIQGSINSLASNGGGRVTNSASSGSAGPKALPAKATAMGKLKYDSRFVRWCPVEIPDFLEAHGHEVFDICSVWLDFRVVWR